jgi:uncharacterized Zn-binding protein involved in type VI secretion
MASISHANGVDVVLSPDGTAKKCRVTLTVATGTATQSKVYADGSLVAIQGDIVQPHPITGCAPDLQSISSASTRVYVQGRGIARIGDTYGDNVITSGSARCFAS